MAVDTDLKRYSMLGFGRIYVYVRKPTNEVDSPARSTLNSIYEGIALIAVSFKAFFAENVNKLL